MNYKQTINDGRANFRKNDQLYLRCYVCDPKDGRENYLPIVATGQCAWKENNVEGHNMDE